jgi:hypothetical protein
VAYEVYVAVPVLAISAPTAATAAVTSGAPPSEASGVNGPSAWLNASRPQGNPPNGARPRSASWPTQTAATHNQRP